MGKAKDFVKHFTEMFALGPDFVSKFIQSAVKSYGVDPDSVVLDLNVPDADFAITAPIDSTQWDEILNKMQLNLYTTALAGNTMKFSQYKAA